MHVARTKYSWPFLLLCGSVALAADPARPGPLYIQGSEVNLRASPSKSADIAAKVRIATECAEVAPKPKEREWVRLKCGEQEGYTLRGLVGAEKPDFDGLLAKATNGRASAQARYDAGMRAVSLMPDSKPAARALRAAFFDLQFQELMQMPEYERAWLSAPASAEILTQSDEVAPGDRKSTPELGFHNAGFDWEDIQARGGNFVYIISRLGRLHVVFGHVEVVGPPIGALAHPMAYKEFELGETLARALSWNGRPNPFGETGNGRRVLRPPPFRLTTGASSLTTEGYSSCVTTRSTTCFRMRWEPTRASTRRSSGRGPIGRRRSQTMRRHSRSSSDGCLSRSRETTQCSSIVRCRWRARFMS